MSKRPLNLFMAENNSESVDVDPPPHSNTDTPGTVTGTCLPVAEHCSRARASVVLLRAMDNALRHSLWSVFFSGYAFGHSH